MGKLRRNSELVDTYLRGLVARQGDFAATEQFSQEALSASCGLDLDEEQAIVLNNLGDLARSQRNYDRAAYYYQQALTLTEKIGDREGQAVRSSNLGRLAIDRGRFGEALAQAQAALQAREQLGAQNLAWTRDLVARLRQKAGGA